MGKGILSRPEAPAKPAENTPAPNEAFPRGPEGARCEEVSLETIARVVGTPAYVYSSAGIREQYSQLRVALGKLDARLHYSVKANSSIAILALLRGLGAGLDIVSGGELYRALKAGYEGEDIVFSGVGKTER